MTQLSDEQRKELKQLRSRTFAAVSDACISGTDCAYQESAAFQGFLDKVILASGPDALTFLLESLHRGLGHGEFVSDEDGFTPATATKSAEGLIAEIKAI